MRDVFYSHMLFLILICTGQIVMANEQLPEHYAESVMIFVLSPDGATEVSLRLARFPDKGLATIWLHIATKDGAWSLAHETFVLEHQDATNVRDDTAAFGAHLDGQQVVFASTQRNAAHMQGHVKASLNANSTRHPELEAGRVPVSLDLRFMGGSQGFRSKTNRWELTGQVAGTITVAGKTYDFNHPGKWHEQTGPRARFAPAFTYFNVQGENLALLAIGFADSVNGYVLMEDQMLGVDAFTIDPEDLEPRAFTLTASDGTVIKGTARNVQAWSVPIEGKRRPGTAILIDSNRGPLIGTLNDWDPE